MLASGLRGRGGGGFPTGRKWSGVAAQTGTRRYVVGNGAEGEPGTFKDRALLRANPYQFVEGIIIAAFAVGAEEAFICLKRSFERELDVVTRGDRSPPTRDAVDSSSRPASPLPPPTSCRGWRWRVPRVAGVLRTL